MFECLETGVHGLVADELNEQLAAVDAVQHRVDVARVAAVSVWDAQKVWAADGATSASAWLRHRFGISRGTAAALVSTVRRLRAMPLVAAAFESGALSYEKVRMLAAVRTSLTAELFSRDEALLVRYGREFGADELHRVLARWKALADEATFKGEAEQRVAARRLSVSETMDGVVRIDGWLDPESGREFLSVFDVIDDELRQADRRDARIDPLHPVRSPQQRRADALTEMARRASREGRAKTGDEPDGRATGGRAPRPELSVIVPVATLLAESGGYGELENGALISGDAARRLACDAGLGRVITGPRSEILDLGRSTPVPSVAQRRAVVLRDGGCVFASCDVPARRCEVHHLVPFRRGRARGGSTDLANLALVCCRHHHLVHEGGYRLARSETGAIETRRPDGLSLPADPRAGPIDPLPWAS